MTITAKREQTRRFAYLDFLRFMCAMSVLVFHFGYVAPLVDHSLPSAYAMAPAISLYGRFGVHIFYIISGFVIALSIENKTVAAFSWSRFLRLYPAYWIAVPFTYVMLVAAGDQGVGGIGQLAVNMTMLQGYLGVAHIDGVYHTLSIELRFYFMIALCALAGWHATSPKLIGGWLCLCALSYLVPPIFGKIVMASWSPYFLAGMTIQSMVSSRPTIIKVALLLGCIALELVIAGSEGAQPGMPYNPFVGQTLVAIGTLLVLGCAFAPSSGQLVRLLTPLGALTYPLYLLHDRNGIILLEWLSPALSPALNIMLVTCVCVLTAYLVSAQLEPRLRKVIKTTGERLYRARSRRSNLPQQA